jgi:hypothetical protein
VSAYFPALAAHDMKILTFQPHTTKIYQCVDLCLFAVFTKRLYCELLLDSIPQAYFHDMKQTFVSDNARSAFLLMHICIPQKSKVSCFHATRCSPARDVTSKGKYKIWMDQSGEVYELDRVKYSIF